MDSKLIAILAIAVVAVVGIGAFAFMGGNDGGDDTPTGDYVTYHGNGGVSSDGSTSKKSSASQIPINFFSCEGKVFYMWNSKSDATGTFYNPENAADYQKLKESGTKDLYAIWAYSITPSPLITETDFSSGLLKYGYFLDHQYFCINSGMIPLPNNVYLDPGQSKATMAFVSQLKVPVTWTHETTANSVTIHAETEFADYTIALTNIVGATDFTVRNTESTIGFDFNYSGNVSFNISFTKVDKKITYLGNGGSHTDDKGTVTTRVLPNSGICKSTYFQMEGYTFVMWAQNSDGTGFSITPDASGKFDQKADSKMLRDSGVTQLYAIWEKVKA